MNTILFSKKVEVRYQAQVVVVGGGPSGFCAAVAAARAGADTLLIEEGGCAGGMATRGLVGPFMTSYDKDGKQMIIRGLFEELVNRMVMRGGAIHPEGVRAGTAFTSWIVLGHDHVTPFEPECLKIVMDEMLAEAGVRVLYHTRFVEPVVQDGTIRQIIIDSKAGLEAVSADVFIDCTGDADVAYRAGVPCEKGNEELGLIQPASLFFQIGNVRLAPLEADIVAHKDQFYRKDGVNYRSLHWRVTEAREHGDWPLQRVSIGLFRGVKEDEWFINTSRVMGVDATDNQSLTRGEIEGRKQVEIIFNFFRKYVPGCEDARLLCSASTFGIRESRHVKGLYRLMTDDLLEGKVPSDSICLASNSVDVHGRFGPLSNQYAAIRNGRWYGIPYRCLVPERIDNLLVAGRCVSAESDAAGAIRVMPPSTAMGQAAGQAAAMAVQQRLAVSDVSVSELQQKLREQGAFLEV
ncbi:MAG: FAD-dependent oxidoreductase [Firmicutes bacterium]|nr:FAD-dependent oxidoreductase [Bacillota bacterium]